MLIIATVVKSLAVIIVNTILKFIIRAFSLRERHET